MQDRHTEAGKTPDRKIVKLICRVLGPLLDLNQNGPPENGNEQGAYQYNAEGNEVILDGVVKVNSV
jgi:hypothetical protein